jgi:uncharacterized repeat protein (TIGR01451 family)
VCVLSSTWSFVFQTVIVMLRNCSSKLAVCLVALATFFLSLVAVATSAQAETVTWNANVNLVTGPDNNRASTPAGVTVTTTGTVQGTVAGRVHALESANNNNGFPSTIRSQMTAATNTGADGLTTSFVFSEPVYNLQFTIEDIDGGPTYTGGFTDHVYVSANAGVLPSAVTVVNAANVNYNAGLGRLEAIANIGIANDQGNATVTFAGPVTSVTVRHTSGPTIAPAPTNQWIFIDDFTFLRSPRLAISKAKVPAGAATTFNFNVGNSGAGTTATTVATSGAAVVGTQIRLNALAATTVTETGPAGWVMNSNNAACTDSNSAASGNPASFNAPIAANGLSFTVPLSNVRAGAVLTCAITDVGATVTIQKTTLVSSGVNFNLTLGNLSSATAVATTSAVSTPTTVAGSPFAVTALGTAVTIQETIPAGWELVSASCTDANNAGAGTFGSVTGGNLLTIPVARVVAGAAINCSLTNSRLPTLQIAKAWGANSVATDTATISATSGGTNNTASFSTAGGTSATSGTAVNINIGNTITLPAETMVPAANLANYTTALACTANGGATANPLSGTNGQVSNTLVIGVGDAGKAIVCTYTNTRKSTTLRLAKSWGANSLNGNVAAFLATTGLTNNTAPFNATAPTNVNGSVVTVFAGETAGLPAETMSPGSLLSYTTTISCDAGTLTGTGNGQSAGNAIAITAAATATNPITCTYANAPKAPTISLQKAMGGVGRIAATDQFRLAITGTGAPPAADTTGAGAAIISAALSFTATSASPYVLNETMAAGSVSLLTQYAQVVACANSLSVVNGGTDVSTLTSLPINVTPHNGDNISCTITNTPKLPTVQLTKISNGGVGTFNFSGGNGFGTDAIPTVTPGIGVSGAIKTLTAFGTVTTITETIPVGWFVASGTCTGTAAANVTFNPLATATTATITLNAAATAAGNVLGCTFTNTLAVPAIQVTKTPSVASVSAAGQGITYTIRVSNSGNVAATTITVSDPLGAVTCPGGNPIPALAPAAFVNCTFTYTVPQSVFDNNGGGDGDIDNTASAAGSTAFGAVNNSSSAVVTLSGGAQLSIVKAYSFAPGGDVNGNGLVDRGDTVAYTYTVTNAGNRTVTGVTVADVHNGYGIAPVPSNEALFNDVAPLGNSTDAAVNQSWDTLAPGDSVRFRANYLVVLADIELHQ